MVSSRNIQIENNKTLRIVQEIQGETPEQLAEELRLSPFKAVVVLAEGQKTTDPTLERRLMQLLGRGILRAVREAQAICIVSAKSDGLLAGALADSGEGLQVLGFARSGCVVLTEEDNAGEKKEYSDAAPPVQGLTHLLLTSDNVRGSDLITKINVATVLANTAPCLLVVVGGGENLMLEVRQAVRRNWTVLVVKGSGAAADTLARQWETSKADEDDPVVAEILADGNLTCITLSDKVAETVETLSRQVLRGTGGESVLLQAWRRFGAIDAAANNQQKDFMSVQWRILTLGVVAVLLSIIYTLIPQSDPNISLNIVHVLKGILGLGPKMVLTPFDLLKMILGFALIIVPIATSVFIAFSNRFKPGKRWVLLRSAAESIKREIYRYRLRAAGYAVDDTREKKLAQTVENITRRLARTEANTTSLPNYDGKIPPVNTASADDDGISLLSTDQYIKLRLRNQLDYYRNKSVFHEKRLDRLQICILLFGAVGTLLAALGDELVIWITLTTALTSAAMSYLGYMQTETTLTSYNQTATDLDNIQTWWTALEPDEQADRDNIEALVTHTEQVLADELDGWTQNMTNALEKLRDTQEKNEADRAEKELKAKNRSAEKK